MKRSVRRLKGGVLCTHRAVVMVNTVCSTVGLQQKGKIKGTGSQSFVLAASANLEIFFADLNLESFFPLFH